jgi:hypothetical protein
MMGRGWIKGILMLIVGLAVGVAGSETYRRFHEKGTGEIFSRRLRCNELAKQYEGQESNEKRAVRTELVDYSATSNSCIAYFTSFEQLSSDHTIREWKVVDLLSGKQFYTGDCRIQTNCGGGKDIMLDRESKAALHQAIMGQDVDVGAVK